MATMTSYAAYTEISAAKVNHVHGPAHGTHERLFSRQELDDSFQTISSWPGYSPTRLVSLAGLAREAGVAQIHYKDEGNRFGLGSFKALGGAYAVHQLVETLSGDLSGVTITSATDGNHGLSVAWGAAQLGCRCVIFIHADVSEGREQALQDRGAEVVRIEGNYDDSVRLCAQTARENGWYVISDTTADPDFRDVPKTVMTGYTVMASEIVDQLQENIPTHVFVQGGVGGLAAAICDYFQRAWGTAAPCLIVVEPELAPCLYESACNGERISVDIQDETMMAGLSCGEVSIVAWPVLASYADHFLTVPDSVVAPAMRLLADAPFGDPPIVAGESAVAGLAALLAASRQKKLSNLLTLTEESRVLIIGTEGATDVALYESITGLTLPGAA